MSANVNPIGWLNTYGGQFPQLLPEYWLPMLRIFDGFDTPDTFLVLPPKKVPQLTFKWRIFIDPADMSPMSKREIAKTRFTGSKAVYENFQCKHTKTGFYLTEEEMDFGLDGVMEREITRCTKSVNRRTEYINLQAMMGNTWNPQFVGRLLNMTRPTWQANGGTPIRDVLTAMLRIWKMSGERPAYIFLGPDEYFFLQDHTTILQYLGLGSGLAKPNDLLCSDFVQCIKALTIKTIDGFYKEDPADYALFTAGTPRVWQPGTGDLNMDTYAARNKHWMLQDRAIITCRSIGFTGIAKNVDVTSRQWEDIDEGVLKWKFERYFTPVVEDYGRIGVITFTGTARDAFGEPTTL